MDGIRGQVSVTIPLATAAGLGEEPALLSGYGPVDTDLVRCLMAEAPASVVWDVLTDLPNYNEWNPHCVRIESTLRLGDPVRMKLVNYANPGTLIPVVEYLCAFEPDRLLAWCPSLAGLLILC